jgi:signal transduction histidine kinase
MYQTLSDSLSEKEKNQVHAYQKFAISEQIEQQEMESQRIRKANTNRTYAMLGGIIALLLIAFLLFRNNFTRKKANKLLQQQNAEIEEQKTKLETTLAELKNAQRQLIHSEKMASLGELTAGIAHEIQNPLNFVNNFSEVSSELVVEMKEELVKGEIEEAKTIADDIISNLEKINHHGKRADAIVKGMLQHSRSSTGQKEPTDINALCDEYLRLSFHGLRAKDKSLSAGQAGFNASLNTEFDEDIGKVNIIPQDFGRVIMNLLTNAFYAVSDKLKKQRQVEGSLKYEPTVSISTKKLNNCIEIKIEDNGDGIPANIVDKIFQPFFTTKPTGQGTGLGLSLSYDIIKAHAGELKMETKEGKGTTFIISLPVKT